eukprot:TRINITY_DN18611_c0_g1_i1.p1 TRINITY_DN18611_c0_g1~~TRINITY_DN18611_c0_g1_i1.p1  ORF type:complete len:264 (-),score=34.32 TRINITY_DN18611_c0_g1_i1:24-755(-)
MRYDDAPVLTKSTNGGVDVWENPNPYINYKWYEKVLWVSARNQQRYWFCKRFITPEIAAHYKYIWTMDDDLDIYNTIPEDVEKIMDKMKLQIATVSWKAPDRPFFHFNHVGGKHTGRYAAYIDMGPLVVMDSMTWQCHWHMLQLDLTGGFYTEFGKYPYCNAFGHQGRIDKYQIIHTGGRTFTSQSNAQGKSFIDLAMEEGWELSRRFPRAFESTGIEMFAQPRDRHDETFTADDEGQVTTPG